MKLSEALFKLPYSAYSTETHAGEDNYLEYELEPLMGPTLASAYVPNRIFQGYFIVSAKVVGPSGVVEDCYLDVTLPERISEHHFRLQDGRIIRGSGRRLTSGKIIPAIAIEARGVYTLYFAKENVDAGIEILRNGLSHARDREPVALDLAYVLRDAGRNEESVEAFTAAIRILSPNSPTLPYCYHERAMLYDKLGRRDQADQDRLKVETLRRGISKSP